MLLKRNKQQFLHIYRSQQSPPLPLAVVSSVGTSQIKAASSYALVCTHIRPARMLSSDESLNRIFSTSWCARFSSHFARIKRSLTGAASPASASCSVAEKFQRWECFSPRGNAISISQCNYQDKTFSLGGEGQSFPPWCVEI